MTDSRNPNEWPPIKETLLRDNYATMPWPELIALLGKTRRAIYTKAHVLGLDRKVPHKRSKNQDFNLAGPKIAPSGGYAEPPRNDFRSRPPYDCPELRPYTGRPGAMDAYALPSRAGNKLTHRDGRVEELV